jgi:hypothetical protein
LILALACVACLAEIAADIDTALRALANAKIHSNAIHPSISTVSHSGSYAAHHLAAQCRPELRGASFRGAMHARLFCRPD